MALSLKDIAKPRATSPKESATTSSEEKKKVLLPWMEATESQPPTLQANADAQQASGQTRNERVTENGEDPTVSSDTFTSERVTNAQHNQDQTRNKHAPKRVTESRSNAQQASGQTRNERVTENGEDPTISSDTFTSERVTNAQHNQDQTCNKHAPKRVTESRSNAQQASGQTRNERVTENGEDPTISSDTSTSERVTNAQHNQDQTRNRTGTRNKYHQERVTNVYQNAQQNAYQIITSMRGLKKQIYLEIFKVCRNKGQNFTGPITYEYLVKKSVYEQTQSSEKSTNSKSAVFRGTIFRLREAGLLNRISFKDGREGWVNFEIPEPYFSLLIQSESSFNIAVTNEFTSERVSERATERATSPSSSISSNYNTTNTREPVTNVPSYVEQVLPNEWKPFSETNFEGIDIEPISEIGFTETHLKQIYTRKLCSREILQESIYRFAFDLSENNKGATIKSSALGLFMGVMNRQGEYAKPDNYKSPREIAAERSAKETLAENERISKLKAETFEAEFNIWWNTLSPEEQKQISPPSTLGERHRTTKARMYYRSEILGETKEPQ